MTQSTGNRFDKHALRLMLAGMTILFWELVLIRWLSSCIRIVAYYSNFVLIAAFFGIGVGALLTRFQVRLQRFVFPAVGGAVLMGMLLGGFYHANPGASEEHIWIGSPFGVMLSDAARAPETRALSITLVLTLVYVVTAGVFAIFGQWIGRLFRHHKALWAYSVEVFGSVLGILLFALMSMLETTPTVWFLVGFGMLLLILDTEKIDYAVAVVAIALTLWGTMDFTNQFVWSPYYRIYVDPLTSTIEKDGSGVTHHFGRTVGYALTVNNDYHQMMLDLTPREGEHEFLAGWRRLYDAPYQGIDELPAGPILIVGAGTGNDVSAALRNTTRRVVAVEIDPGILGLGRKLHPEKPYQNERVTIINDDARTVFQHTDERFALVVFGFLDSHTLLSSFTSVRLDNFVYTRQSMEQVKRILLPGGQVRLTFATYKKWIHERLLKMLDEVFDQPTEVWREPGSYANGMIYMNAVAREGEAAIASTEEYDVVVPTDDWPFLYLEEPVIPQHYIVFMLIALSLGFLSLLALPKGDRTIRLPYFFLGAAFFLIETSNVVSLSLLFGSTWIVNVLVFTGILCLVLLGNLTSALVERPKIQLYFGLLIGSIGVAAVVTNSQILSIESALLRNVAACLVFLGPVYFASLIFASLIREEENLYQAYGSNILGAVVGGVCEYFSLIFGFQFLLGITLIFYLLAFVSLRRTPASSAT